MLHQETAEAYHARKAVSAGFLWRMVSECPAQAYYDSCFNPDAPPQMRSLEFDIGSATHLLTLEGADFAARVTLIPYETYQSKDARDLRDQAYIDGRTPLRPKDYRLVSALYDALRKSDAAELLFGGGQNEVSYTWDTWPDNEKALVDIDRTDPFSKPVRAFGIPCKARADRITPHAIVDLKTAASASPAVFQRAMIREGHHLRAAWYLDGLLESWEPGGIDTLMSKVLREYLFVVVAKTPPHLVEVYRLDERSLAWGRTLYRKALREFRRAQETGEWSGYGRKGENVNTMLLPAFAENLLIAQERAGEFDHDEDDVPY